MNRLSARAHINGIAGHVVSQLILISLALLVFAGGWFIGGPTASKAMAAPVATAEVIELPAAQALQWQRRLGGLVQAVQQSSLSFEVGGLLAKVAVGEGGLRG